MDKKTRDTLENLVNDLMESFEVYSAPIPIEIMLQNPPEGFWEDVDIAQLSGSFLSIRHRYSPRMSTARMLARHIISSDWGKEHNLMATFKSYGDDFINMFARMLIMPQAMLNRLSSSHRNPTSVSMQFEVPEDDAQQRLLEIV